jgi:hypothetical protein
MFIDERSEVQIDDTGKINELKVAIKMMAVNTLILSISFQKITQF